MDSNESVKDKKNPNSHLKTYKWPLKYKWMIILFIVLEVKIKTKTKYHFTYQIHQISNIVCITVSKISYTVLVAG